MGGRMLAINEGFGYRTILTVKNFNFLPQFNQRPPSTFIYGVQLMTPADMPSVFYTFLRPFYGQKLLWSQVDMATEDTEEMVYSLFPRMPLKLVANEELTLLSAGKDPLGCYYVQFAGDLKRLFTQPDWWVDSQNTQY